MMPRMTHCRRQWNIFCKRLRRPSRSRKRVVHTGSSEPRGSTRTMMLAIAAVVAEVRAVCIICRSHQSCQQRLSYFILQLKTTPTAIKAAIKPCTAVLESIDTIMLVVLVVLAEISTVVMCTHSTSMKTIVRTTKYH
jgi:cobalamin synthase